MCASYKQQKMDVNKMNLSLNGCGYLGIYHVGVCACIRKYYPHALKYRISGGSVGALVACAFMCDVPLCKYRFMNFFYFKLFLKSILTDFKGRSFGLCLFLL